MSALWVEILATRGSAPRDAGTAMRVTPETTEGTIGGGALEHQAIARARAILAAGGGREEQTIPLGPGLGQCCGGAVTLRFGPEPGKLDAALPAPLPRHGGSALPLWLWGAGHVGRAIVALAPPEDFALTWVDDAAARFPEAVPSQVTRVVAADMPLLAGRAPEGAHHLIFTYSHEIDLALCAALLKRRAGSIGLIGSATKWARFRRRLEVMGLDPLPITCPIGDKREGKTPAAIARSTLAALTAPRRKATA